MREEEEAAPTQPVVLAIAGCSGSGKTTLANELARLLGGAAFQFDAYYRDLSHLEPKERARQNFDDPVMIEDKLLIQHLSELAAGRSIERPIYNFSSHCRERARTQHFSPGPYLFVEGLFALYFPALLPLYHLRIYVATADKICFERRLNRDVTERGRTPESVRWQYNETVRPSGMKFVRPSRRHADLFVDGNGDLDWKVEQVLAEMRQRKLIVQPAAKDPMQYAAGAL